MTGLLGADGGLLWLLGGVWTVRLVWGRDPGVAWGVACLAGALRWGTLSLADMGAASRLAGPAIATEPVVCAVGAGVALGAALMDEARIDGLRERAVVLRVPAAIAIVGLVAALCVPGPGDPVVVAWWAAAAAGVSGTVLFLRPIAAKVPAWAPTVVASAGTALVGLAR